jgi:hypothetical protein
MSRWRAVSSRPMKLHSAVCWRRWTRPRWRPRWGRGWIRGHGGIEALHHIRDVTYGEDASQIRTGNGSQVIAILKPGGYPSAAAACRYHARDATRVLATLGISPV